jgi:DNA-binding NarL/FixJ family response regulator
VRVAVADDSALFRSGLVRLLEAAGVAVTAQAGDGKDLLRLMEADQPDVAIVDIRMPPTMTDEGLKLAREIRSRWPAVAVLVLSTYLETDFATELISASERRVGYLLKDRVEDTDELLDALDRLAHGGSIVDREVVARLLGRRRTASPLDALSAREREILGLMAQGLTNLGIRERLFLSERTVESHVNSIFAKLGLEPTPDNHRRVTAVLLYLGKA